MIILGVNGWYERGHDASACIVQDGQLIAAVEEERLIRQKHAYDAMPLQSIAWCLNHCGINVDDIDAVAVGWDIPNLYARHRRKVPFQTDQEYLDILLPRKYFGSRKHDIPVHFIDHHCAHAASAFYLSGFDSSLIFVIDGQGEDVATSIWRGEDGLFYKITSFPVSLSLGYFFEAVSSFIGFSTTHAGKTMGLAGYGKLPDVELFQLEKEGYALRNPCQVILSNSELDEQSQLFNYWNRELTEIFGEPNQRHYYFSGERGVLCLDTHIAEREQKIAALAQHEIERVILHLVEVFTRKTEIRNLCITGGVALNCTCNGKIALSGLVDNMFIQPAAHDAGVAIGAALEVAQIYSELKHQSMVRADIGPSYSDGEISTILKNIGIQFYISENVAQETAELIAQGNIVGWFQGGCEIGPRALGSRSILADPCSRAIRDRTNKVKGREQWRPLSPSVIAEKSSWMMGQDINSPFMLQGLPVAVERRKDIEGVVHVDGTARPQTVSKELERYYQMIVAFESVAGVPLVLNTSFNGPGEPIVCTPYHAISCFFDRPLDVLVLGNCIIRKEKTL